MWNTGGFNLAIIGSRKIITTVPPYNEGSDSPTVVFCNVGVLDDQIPDEIKEKYPGFIHKPAYWDDSGRIIAFDFSFNEFGVQYLNRLETEVKKSYNKMNGKYDNTAEFPSSEIVDYVMSGRGAGGVEEEVYVN